MEPRLKDHYKKHVIQEMMKIFNYKNINQVPTLSKIILNMGLGEAIQNARVLEVASGEVSQIVGQRPVITRARKSIAGFKIRKGMPIGCRVTLRRARMWEFFDRLVNVALPRVRDFRGVTSKSFDGRGNYTLGLEEQIIFPEIDYDKVDKIRGLSVAIVTTARTDEESFHLLKLMGMPFRTA